MRYAFFAVHEAAQHINLVLHKCDKRRDHDCRALRHQGGQLVTEAFTSPGRHQHEGIAAVEKMVDHLLLVPLESVVPEESLQRAMYLRGVVFHKINLIQRMNRQPGTELRLEPGSLRRHYIAGIGNVGELLHRHGIECQSGLHFTRIDATLQFA